MSIENVELPCERGESGLHVADEQFVHEWVSNGYKVGKAYQAVWPDESSVGAEAKGKVKLKEPLIAAYVCGVVKAHLDKYNVTEQRIIEELANIGFLDPVDFMDKDGSLINKIQDVPERSRRAVAGISEDASGKVTFKIANKEKALELLGKHMKMFTDMHEVSTKEDLAKAILAARGRNQNNNEVEDMLG